VKTAGLFCCEGNFLEEQALFFRVVLEIYMLYNLGKNYLKKNDLWSVTL